MTTALVAIFIIVLSVFWELVGLEEWIEQADRDKEKMK